MAKKKFNFHNGDLIRDLEKIKDYDSVKIGKDEIKDDGVYIMDVNDSAYFYVNKSERNEDVKALKEYLA
jgi:hypothetical protein